MAGFTETRQEAWLTQRPSAPSQSPRHAEAEVMRQARTCGVPISKSSPQARRLDRNVAAACSAGMALLTAGGARAGQRVVKRQTAGLCSDSLSTRCNMALTKAQWPTCWSHVSGPRGFFGLAGKLAPEMPRTASSGYLRRLRIPMSLGLAAGFGLLVSFWGF